jgi:predicted nucleic acid-binding protein
MNVVDSSAWLSYFSDDENASNFATVVESPADLIIPSITIIEVFKRVFQQRGEELALQVIAQMQQSKAIPLDDGLALDAAHFGLKHKLPLADSIIYAASQKFDATLWTQDVDFKGLDNVMYFPKK